MRSSYAESQIPVDGKTAIPYADRREMAGQFRHGAESFVGEVTGAGGVGGVLRAIPFEPAVVDVYTPSVPLGTRSMPGSAARVNVNLITLAPAAVPVAIAADDLNPGKWKITLTTAQVPDAALATVVCTGFRQVGGSL